MDERRRAGRVFQRHRQGSQCRLDVAMLYMNPHPNRHAEETTAPIEEAQEVAEDEEVVEGKEIAAAEEVT